MIYIDDSEPEGALEPAFPYRDVAIKRNVDANSLYDILGEVGRGKFGTVYRCQEKCSGLKLAAKFVPIPKREDKRNVEREVEIMNSLQHHLIIQLYAAYEYQKMMCVVLELVEGGELFDRVVDDEFVLTERACVVFIRQVCEAMEFIHRNNILHLDLKPENILCLTQEGNRIKIIDFGLARKYDPNKKLQILFGTPEFVAPEVVNFDCISYGTDMWSVGVICYVLISGLSPFMGETDIETMANVTIAKYDFEDESFSSVSPECLDFISKLLVKDLSTRMTAAQCLEHKWLQRRAKAPSVLTEKSSNILTTGTTGIMTATAKLKTTAPSKIPSKFDENIQGITATTKTTPATITTSKPSSKNSIPTKQGTIISTNTTENELEKAMKTGKELETTKDNLKNFIERWEEHPNSPYVFDVESNVIAPMNDTSYKLPHGPDSISSSRVCSPSPCESFDTLTDDEEVFLDDNESPNMLATPVNESKEKLFPSNSPLGTNENSSGATTPTPLNINSHQMPFGSSAKSYHNRSIQSYLHTFDRRNSDTNYLLGRRSSGERVNLADEIKKLSDHLLMLAQINTKLGKEGEIIKVNQNEDINNNKAKSTSKVKSTKSSISSTSAKSIGTSEGSTNTSSTTSSSILNSTASSNMKSNISSSSDSKSKLAKLQQSIDETPKLLNGWVHSSSFTNSQLNNGNTYYTSHTRTSTSSVSSSTSQTASSSDNAKAKRSKFRITQMSRDVPVGLPNTHQTVNLEEAANTTKDCLLHLLEKYNENTIKARNPMTRHQSISVDWHISDNLEYRSMSSINAFFQRQSQFGDGKLVKQLRAQLESKASGK